MQSRIDNSETHDTERRKIRQNIENQNGEYHGIHQKNREGVCVLGREGGGGGEPRCSRRTMNPNIIKDKRKKT